MEAGLGEDGAVDCATLARSGGALVSGAVSPSRRWMRGVATDGGRARVDERMCI